MATYVKNCAICGVEFITTASNKKYCKNKHYKPCFICGKYVYCLNSSRGFCNSRSCMAEAVRIGTYKKYGVINPSQLSWVQDKIKENNLKKYGHTSHMKSKYFYSNVYVPSIREKYNVDNVFQSEIVKDKIKETNKLNLGVEYPMQNKDVIAKSQETFRNSFGFKNIWQKHLNNYNDWDNIGKFIRSNKNQFTIKELCDYFNCSVVALVNRLKKEGVLENIKVIDNDYSGPELQIKYLLDDLGLLEGRDYVHNCRNIIYPQEIDFYLPNLKLGIEVSPSFTHQYIDGDLERGVLGVTTKDYHYSKYFATRNLDIDLITIFDWTSFDIYKEIITRKINKFLYDINFEVDDFCVELDNNLYTVDNSNGIHFNMVENNFELFNEVEPQLINDGRFQVYDCGKTIYKKHK